MKKILALSGILFTAIEGQAIVNIENIRLAAPREGFSAQVEAAINGSSGNTDKIGATSGTRLQWTRGQVTQFTILRYAYGESAGKRDTNNSFFHARHLHQRTSWRADEYYIQGETNEFARLTFRGLIGAGQRFTLLEAAERYALTLNLGAFHALEKLDEKAGTTDAETERFWRLSAALNYKHQINAQVHFGSTTYYQPRFDRVSDYRILEETELGVKMSDRLTLKLGLDIIHDSQPPQTVEKTDIVYSTGLEYRF